MLWGCSASANKHWESGSWWAPLQNFQLAASGAILSRDASSESQDHVQAVCCAWESEKGSGAISQALLVPFSSTVSRKRGMRHTQKKHIIFRWGSPWGTLSLDIRDGRPVTWGDYSFPADCRLVVGSSGHLGWNLLCECRSYSELSFCPTSLHRACKRVGGIALLSPQFRWTQKHLRQRCKDTLRYSAWLGPVATCQSFACRLAHKSLHHCIHGKSHLPQTAHTAKLLGSALGVCHPMAMGHGTSFGQRQNTGWNRPQWVS